MAAAGKGTEMKLEFLRRGDTVAIDRLHDCPDNPRREYDDDADRELAASIRELGQLVPLIVRPWGADFAILAGSRRVRAGRLAGLETMVVDTVAAEVDAGAVAAAENLERASLSFVEELRLVEGVAARVSGGVEDVAIAIGRSTTWTRQRMACLRLEESARELVASRTLAMSAALTLAAYPPDQQRELAATLASRFADGGQAKRQDVIWASDRMRRRLTLASWPLDDAANGGTRGTSCDGCQCRTDVQADLFGAKESDAAECLDPVCWSAKAEASFEAVAAEHRAAGGKEAAASDWQIHVELEQHATWEGRWDGVKIDGVRATWGDVLEAAGKLKPKARILVKGPDGRPCWYFPRKEAEKIAAKLYPKPTPEEKAAADVKKGGRAATDELRRQLEDRVESRLFSEALQRDPLTDATLLELIRATASDERGEVFFSSPGDYRKNELLGAAFADPHPGRWIQLELLSAFASGALPSQWAGEKWKLEDMAEPGELERVGKLLGLLDASADSVREEVAGLIRAEIEELGISEKQIDALHLWPFFPDRTPPAKPKKKPKKPKAEDDEGGDD